MRRLFSIKNKRVFYCLLIPLLCLAQCQNNRNLSPELFSSWFINPLPENNSITKQINSSNIDYFINAIRQNAKTGRFTEILRDTANVAFTVGVKTPLLIKSDSTYPLIIYLHGGTGTQVTTKGELAYEMLGPLADSMGLFLVSPSANATARWWDATGMSRILQTLRYMTLHYPIDDKKVFLAGVSDGATGCWAAANSINSPFAGFFAISGYGGMLPMTGMQLYPENLIQRPIYNINAGNDRLYPLEIINRFIDYIIQSGVPVISKIYPDQNHGFDYRNQEYGTLCKYLRLWERPTYRSTNWNFVPNRLNYPDNILQWQLNDPNKAYFHGHLNTDTLVIRSKGVESVVLKSPQTKIKIVRVNNKNAKKVTIYTPDAKQKLQIMRQSCFPVLSSDDLLEIKL